jgi:phage shock protein PspC (stress-responsive transcriptional regulator)
MNKIISANINGFIFQIDELAYENLKTYLNAIRQKVSNEEVVADIENRIAELFDYKLRNGRQAIFQDDVQDIIQQIGNPNQFGSEESTDGEPAAENATTGTSGSRRRGYRRLYRNDDDKVIGGVCSGIAAYFDIDPLIPRIIFAISFFFFGSGLLLYLFLMIVLPKALTPSEKLEMRGEPVDYKNITKTLEKDFRETYERFRPEMRSGFSRVGGAAMKIGTVLLMILLVSIFIPGCFGILTSIGVASWSLPVLSSYIFISHTEGIIILIGFILFFLVPIVGIGYKLARMVFKTRPMNRILTVFLSILWIIGFCLLAYSTFNIGKQFSSWHKITTTDTISAENITKTLVIRANHSHNHSEFIVKREHGDDYVNFQSSQDMKEFLDEKISENIDLRVLKGINAKPVIKVTKRSAGYNRSDASANAQNINYTYTVRDSVIYLDDFFSLGSEQLWRNQKVVVTIEVPEGYRLFIDNSCHRMFDTDLTRHRYHHDHEGLTGRYLNIDANGINVPEEKH